ncbi:MAG: uroporphyrinogen-III synthase [Bacteroidales bacterium]|nr:uroporphyrinogen-III synthase [Bacteroidales bacterium]MDN5330186.1 uroporphyrinogen-III synthase [Bacteroidales bacterium]
MKIRKVLISQPRPEDIKSSPYTPIAETHGLEVDYQKLFKIEPLDGKEFRRQKIRMEEYSAIIFTSKNAVDYFFQQVKEARYPIPETMKYFCTSEAIALYLQNYITYRKRKIFFGKGSFNDLEDLVKKFKTEKYLIPCGDTRKNDVPPFMEKLGVEHKKVVVYKTVPRDLKNKLDIKKYDLLVFFSPMGIKSLLKNWPDYSQKKQVIATFGENTAREATEHGLIINIMAPTPTAPSMASAIEQFLIEQKKRKKTSTKANANSAKEAEKSDSDNIPPAEDEMTSPQDENTPKEQEKGQINH